MWLSSPGSVARSQVMIAARMVADHLGVTAADAVKLLKAHAYAGQGTTDDVAAPWSPAASPSTCSIWTAEIRLQPLLCHHGAV